MTYQTYITAANATPLPARDGLRIPCIWPCPGIEPRNGAALYEGEEEDNQGFRTPTYFARLPDRDLWLDVCRFRFTPTQARFDWLVDNGFPKRPGVGPWTDILIDDAIAAAGEARAAA